MRERPKPDMTNVHNRRDVKSHFLLTAAYFVALAVIAVALCGAKAKVSHQFEPLCFAFLEGGTDTKSDLFLSCDGWKEQITNSKDIWDFAIAEGGNSLALLREKGECGDSKNLTKQIPTSAAVGREVETISLSPDFERHRSGLGGGGRLIEASCGTILAIAIEPSTGNRMHRNTIDCLTGKRFQFAGYDTFRCSSDSKTVIGHIDTERRVLMAGTPPRIRIAEAPVNEDILPYALSPNGRYVAYVTSSSQLHLLHQNEEIGTVELEDHPASISVSNAGGVLMFGGTGQTCYRDKAGDWSTKPTLTYTEPEQCLGILYWLPGYKSAEVVEMFGRKPQWLTSNEAGMLRAWRNHLKSSRGTNPK